MVRDVAFACEYDPGCCILMRSSRTLQEAKVSIKPEPINTADVITQVGQWMEVYGVSFSSELPDTLSSTGSKSDKSQRLLRKGRTWPIAKSDVADVQRYTTNLIACIGGIKVTSGTEMASSCEARWSGWSLSTADNTRVDMGFASTMQPMRTSMLKTFGYETHTQMSSALTEGGAPVAREGD